MCADESGSWSGLRDRDDVDMAVGPSRARKTEFRIETDGSRKRSEHTRVRLGIGANMHGNGVGPCGQRTARLELDVCVVSMEV
jgi:hypothetical protein